MYPKVKCWQFGVLLLWLRRMQELLSWYPLQDKSMYQYPGETTLLLFCCLVRLPWKHIHSRHPHWTLMMEQQLDEEGQEETAAPASDDPQHFCHC